MLRSHRRLGRKFAASPDASGARPASTVWTSIVTFALVVVAPCLAVAPALGSGLDAQQPALSPVAPDDASLGAKRLINARVGYSLRYPSDWRTTGQVQATGFARGAICESVEVIDFEPPAGSGPTAVFLHSFVQICARPLTGGSSLDQFMRRTYGVAFVDRFEKTTLGGMPAYRARQDSAQTTYFLQTDEYRVQIVSAVAAPPEKRSARESQLERILESFVLNERRHKTTS